MWRRNFFLHSWEDTPLWEELKSYGGVIFITTLSLFHFFKNSQHPKKSSVSFTYFFRECEYIRSCCLLIPSNLLKKSFRKTSLFVLTVTGVLEKKCSAGCLFQTIVVIVVIKILEKYWLRSSILERNFKKLFVSMFI